MQRIDESLRQQYLSEIVSEREVRLHDVPTETRLWLAVVPVWTTKLAEAARFPVAVTGLDATIALLEGEGLCRLDSQARNFETDEVEARFWMPSAARTVTLRDVRANQRFGHKAILDTVGEVGKCFAALDDRLLLPALRRWAQVARFAPDVSRMCASLREHVEKCIAENRPDEGLNWTTALKGLADLIGGDFALTMGQQARLLDLVFLRRDDERYLTNFLIRTSQLASFEALVEGPDDAWALHFLGAGGVGKTMMLRYISGRWCREHGASVARIDFDFLNPEFPSRAPALLLGHLAQDLRLHDQSGQSASIFARFDQKLEALHQRARGRPALETDLTATSDDFQSLLDVFSDAVRALPGQVVLLLDTCEELAKARLEGAGLPDNVRATFQILEALHARQPQLRVVFCGRRPLASAGTDWEIRSCSYEDRPYLRLYRITGFTRNEARSYLDERRKVPGELIDPILEVSTDATRHDDGNASQEPHYSPFALNLYAQWACEDSSLTPALILSGDTDAYVAMRIVARIRRPALRALLPAMVYLSRFDRPLLRAISTASTDEFQECLLELWEQDWLERPGADLFEVKPELRRRLALYFERNDRRLSPAMRERAINHLMAVTGKEPLGQLGFAHFDALIRLLASRPIDAFAWWERMEARFAAEEQWAWASELVERLLSDEGAVGRSASREGDVAKVTAIQPAVLATYGAVLMRQPTTQDVHKLWSIVLAGADQDPRPHGRRRLRARAIAAKAASSRGRPEFVPAAVDFAAIVTPTIEGDALEQELTASQWIAAAEAMVEEAELGGLDATAHYDTIACIADAIASARVARELVAFARTLAARMARLANRTEDALKQWERAVALAEGVAGVARQRWLDWNAPDDVAMRIRLEFARSAFPALMTSEEVLARLPAAIPSPRTLDADRLGAMMLQLRGRTARPRITDAREHLRSSNSGEMSPRCSAHDATPPLFAAYWVEQALSNGDIESALGGLKRRFDDAELNVRALPTLEAIEIARMRIARRMRLRDEDRIASVQSPVRRGTSGVQFVLETAIAAFDARLTGDRREALRLEHPTMVFDADWRHRLWRTFAILDSGDAACALDLAHSEHFKSLAPGELFGNVSCALDLVEASLIAEKFKLPAPFKIADVLGGKPLQRVDAFREHHPLAFEEHLRLTLRLVTLCGGSVNHVTVAADRLGARFAAQVALEEGELLALRLPHLAKPLLQRSVAWFRHAGDPVGETIAEACLMLSEVRDEVRFHLRWTAGRLGDAYERMRAVTAQSGSTNLPAWTRLQEIAERPTESNIDLLAPSGWRPWLVRIVACMAMRNDWLASDARNAVIRRWILINLATITPNEIAVPPELVPWRITDDHLSERSARKFTEVHVRSKSEGREYGDVEVRWSVEGAMVAEFTGRLLSDVPYVVAADEGFAGASSLIQANVAFTNTPIHLFVDAALAGACWEAIVARWLQADPEQIDMVRQPLRSRGLSDADIPWDVAGVVSVVGDVSLIGPLESAWHAVRQDPDVALEVMMGRELSAALNLGRSRSASDETWVIHVLGLPVQTGYGDYGVQVGDPTSSQHTNVYSEAAHSTSGDVIRMHDLAQLRGRSPRQNVYVLQAPPIVSQARSVSDRECARYLRILATELSTLGAAGVLVVPPVSLEIGVACVESLATAVSESPGTMRAAMHNAAFALKQAIARGAAYDDESRREATSDIMLVLADAPVVA